MTNSRPANHYRAWSTKGQPYAAATNNQVADSIVQANVKVIGNAPAVSTGNIYAATSQAVANAAHNATENQKNKGVVMQAATKQAVALLYSVDVVNQGVMGKL